MGRLLPSAFLFRFALPVPCVDASGMTKYGTLPLPKSSRLQTPSTLDEAETFAELSVGWNETGLAIAVSVSGKRNPLQCDASHAAESDGLQVWIDTRNTQSIHRASRFCHHFCILPLGQGRGKKKPVVVQQPIARAKGDAPFADAATIPVHSEITDDGYRMDVWFPEPVLHGFDPEASPRLGFYACVKDRELGDQPLTVGPEFPYTHDPSLWSTLNLVRD